MNLILFLLALSLVALPMACTAPQNPSGPVPSGPVPSGPSPGEQHPPSLALQDAINRTCPRSGLPIAADSLTTYRGRVVGFCNPHCRDDFAADPSLSPNDVASFDALIDNAN